MSERRLFLRSIKSRRERYEVRGDAGGELGIRTLEAFRPTAFRVLHLRPLGQLSMYSNVKTKRSKFQAKIA